MLNALGAVVAEARALMIKKGGNYHHCINCSDSCEFYALGNALYNLDVAEYLEKANPYDDEPKEQPIQKGEQ